MPYQQPYQPMQMGQNYAYPYYAGNDYRVSPTYVPSAPMPQNPTPQYQNNTAHQVIGRTVSDPNQVMPGEVARDGSMSVFPMADGSAVYGKMLQPDGTIRTVRYVPEQADQPTQQDPLAAFMSHLDARMDALEQKLDQRQYNKQGKRPQNQQKGAQNAES